MSDPARPVSGFVPLGNMGGAVDLTKADVATFERRFMIFAVASDALEVCTLAMARHLRHLRPR